MNQRLKADLVLASCSLIWGATFVLVKDVLAYSSVLAFVGARFLLAAAVMAAIYWRAVRSLGRPAIAAGTLMGVLLFAGYIFQTVGLKFTTASKSAFLTGSSVVLVPVMVAVFARRRISSWAWAGAFTALGGLYLMAVPPSGLAHLNLGDALSFGGATMFALHIIVVGRYSRRHPVVGLSFLQVTVTGILAAAAVPLSAAARWEAPRLDANGTVISTILITAIGCTVLGFTGQVWAQQHTTPHHAAILFALEPVFAALTSFVVLGERLAPRTLAGASLILLGILLAELMGPAQAAVDSTGPVTNS